MGHLKIVFYVPEYELVSALDVNDYVVKEELGTFSCQICGKSNNQKNNIKNHIEAVHFPDQFTYNCHLCNKSFVGKNSLAVHRSKFHSITKF